MAKWQWAALWKRTAKNYRALFKLCVQTSIPLWKERYWAAQKSARAWKAVAKRWRERALEWEDLHSESEDLRLELEGLYSESADEYSRMRKTAKYWQHRALKAER